MYKELVSRCINAGVFPSIVIRDYKLYFCKFLKLQGEKGQIIIKTLVSEDLNIKRS